MSDDKLNIEINLDYSAAIRSLNLMKGALNSAVSNASNFTSALEKAADIAKQLDGKSFIATPSGELQRVADLQSQLDEQVKQLQAGYEKHAAALSGAATTINIQLVGFRALNEQANRARQTHERIEQVTAQTQRNIEGAANARNLPVPAPVAAGMGGGFKLAAITAGAMAFGKVQAAAQGVGRTISRVTGTLDQFNIGRLAAKADPALNLIKGLFNNFGQTVAKIIDWVTTRLDSAFTHWGDSAHASVGALGAINGALDRLFKMITKHVVAIRERISAGLNAEGSFIPGLERAVQMQERFFGMLWKSLDGWLIRIENRVKGSPLEGFVRSMNAALNVGEPGGLSRVADVFETMAGKVGAATETLGKVEANMAGAAAVATGRFAQTSGVVAGYASAVEAAVQPARLLNRTLQVETNLVHGVNSGLAFLRRGYGAIVSPIQLMRSRQEQLNSMLENTPASYRRAAIAIDYLKMAFGALRMVVSVVLVPIRLFVQAILKILQPITALAKVLTGIPGRLLGFGRGAASATGRAADLTAAAGNLSASLVGVASASRRAERATTNIFMGGKNGLKNMVGSLLSSKLALGAMAAAAFSWGATTAIATETANVKFGTLLRSQEQGVALNKELVSFSAVTPFSVDSLRTATTSLLASKVAARDVTTELGMIGDISSGLSQPVEEFAQIYQKMATAPKVDLGMLQQMAERGVPIYDELQKVVGGSRAEMFKMISAGELGFGSVRTAMQNMTKEGGIFHNSMQAQSETFAGMWSTLKDNVAIALEQVSGVFIESSKSLMGGMISIVQSIAAGLATIRPAITAVMVFWRAMFRTIYASTLAMMSAIGGFITDTFGVATDSGTSWLQSFVEMSVTATAAATFFVQNWHKGMTIVFVYIALKTVQLGSLLSNFFLNTLPTVVRVAFGLLFQLLSAVVSNIGTIIGFVGSALTALPGIVLTVLGTIGNVLLSLPGAIVAVFQTLVSVVPVLLSAAWSIITTLFMAVPKLLLSVGSVVLKVIGGVLGGGVSVIAGFVDGLGSGFMAILNLIPQAVGGMVTMILTGLGALYGWFTETLPGLLSYFWQNWSTMFWNAGKWLVNTFVSAITNIGSLFEGLWNWITGSGGDALAAVATNVTNALKKGIDEIAAVPSRNVGSMESSLKNTLADVSAGFGEGMQQDIAKALAALGDKKDVALSGATGADMTTIDGATADTGQTRTRGNVAESLNRDSAETLRAIFNAQGNKQAEKQLKAQERSAKAAEEGTGYLRSLASRQPEAALEAF